LPSSSQSCTQVFEERDGEELQPFEAVVVSKGKTHERTLGDVFVTSAELSMISLWRKQEIRTRLCLHWCFSFLSISLDEAFPLFCMSTTAGFGLSEIQIGKILSTCGLFFVISQYFAHSIVYDRFGLNGSIRVGSLCSIFVFFIPLSVLLNRGASPGQLRWSTFLYLAIVLGMFRSLSMIFFANLAVSLNRTVPVEARATMNGFAMLGASIANGCGPAFGGVLVACSISILKSNGSCLIFGTVGLVGCMFMAFAFKHIIVHNPDDCSLDLERRDESSETGLSTLELSSASKVVDKEPSLVGSNLRENEV
jgi:hypothetical protein